MVRPEEGCATKKLEQTVDFPRSAVFLFWEGVRRPAFAAAQTPAAGKEPPFRFSAPFYLINDGLIK